jgi:hypothetical protein
VRVESVKKMWRFKMGTEIRETGVSMLTMVDGHDITQEVTWRRAGGSALPKIELGSGRLFVPKRSAYLF